MHLIGLTGLFLVVIGFGYQMVDTIRRRKCDMKRSVLGLFIIAGLLLFYYAASVGDEIFMALNISIVVMNAVNFYYA